MNVEYLCWLCPEPDSNRHKCTTLAAAKLHLEYHLQDEYTPELDKQLTKIPGKRLEMVHIDYKGGNHQTMQTIEFYLPDGRAWVHVFRGSTSQPYHGG